MLQLFWTSCTTTELHSPVIVLMPVYGGSAAQGFLGVFWGQRSCDLLFSTLMANQGELASQEENVPGCSITCMVHAAQLSRQKKTALICTWAVLSLYIHLILDRQLFPRLGLIFCSEALGTRLGMVVQESFQVWTWNTFCVRIFAS